MDFSASHNFISAIGWSLMHFVWQGTLITLIYWLITRSIKSIHAKYWTGMSLVLVSLLVPTINSIKFNKAPLIAENIDLTSKTFLSYQQFDAESLLSYLIELSLPYLVMAWALIVLFLSIRLIKSWLSLAAIKHECDPNISSQLKACIKNIAIKLDLPCIPLLKVSKDVLVPAAYGIFKPTILLPLSLINQIPKEQLEAIIKHELCHLKRNDFLHNLVQLIADTLLFFHPGIRWMNNDIRHVREQCCDQMVLSQQTEAITYAKALTNIASYTQGLKFSRSIHIGINDGMLLNRVKFLLQNNSKQSSLIVFMPIILLIFMTVFILQPKNEEHDVAHLSQFTEQNSNPKEQKTKLPTRNISQQYFYPAKPKQDTKIKPPTLETVVSPKLEYVPVYTQTELLNNETLKKIESELINNQEISNTNPIQEIAPLETFVNEKVNLSHVETTYNSNIETNESNVPIERSSFNESTSIMPTFKRYIAPTYPHHFWYNQVEQDVIVTFKIKPNGKVYDINVSSQKNQFVAFEQEVIRALKRWKFETESLNHTILQRTYQQFFSFAISESVEKNCELIHTGSRMKKAMPCNK